MSTFATEAEFLKHEVMVWGEDEIDAFLNDGFVPAVVDGKWTWVQTVVPLRRISGKSQVRRSMALAA